MKFKEYLVILAEDAASQKEQVGRQLIKQYGEKYGKEVAGFDNFEDFIKKILKADPSPKGSYAPWLTRMLLKDKDANKLEDLNRAVKDIKVFDANKHKLSVKDINQIKTFAQLYDVIEPFTTKKPLNAQERAARRAEKIKADIITVYDGPEGWVKIPTTKKAAQLISQSTRWCTGAKCDNKFDDYNRQGKLFVIYDKASKERFQLHIETSSYNDVKDAGVGLKNVPKWASDHVLAWFKKNKDNLTGKDVLAFVKMGQHAAAKGTDHEDAVELMKKYGVL